MIAYSHIFSPCLTSPHSVPVRSLLKSVALIAACALGVAIPSVNVVAADIRGLVQCTLIDNDFDIDDLMALPVVIGSEPVVAVIQTEGYTEPEMAAPVVDILLHGTSAGDTSARIPIIAGGSQQTTPDLSHLPWVPFFRSMLNRGNGLLDKDPKPWKPGDRNYPDRIVELTKNCDEIRVLVIGPYTSFIRYYPLIESKVTRIVIMGQPIGDESATPDKESFNCSFDMAACQSAMVQLRGKRAFFVDIPRFKECREAASPPPHCYAPTLEMIAGGSEQDGLKERGLAGRVRKALLNTISCQAFYTSEDKKNRPCSSRSTWQPEAVALGPGGEALMWDQSAALFLVEPEAFVLFYPADNPSLGGRHYEPRLIDGSHAKTIEALRQLYTDYANRSAGFN